MPINIVCAAGNTPSELKRKANFVCESADARPVMQAAIDEAIRLGVSCILLPGTYEINSCGERSKKGAICFYNPTPASFLYRAYTSYAVLEGIKTPFGFREGAIVTLGKKFYDSLSDEEDFSVFYSDGNDPYSHGMILRNLGVQLPASNKPVVVFDGRFSAGLRYEDCWASCVDLDHYDHATASGVQIPHPRSVGFRGCHGSNNYTSEWKNLATIGFGVGFDIGGEHVYCESLSAYHGIYGFCFDCYKGKRSIDDPDWMDVTAPPKIRLEAGTARLSMSLIIPPKDMESISAPNRFSNRDTESIFASPIFWKSYPKIRGKTS